MFAGAKGKQKPEVRQLQCQEQCTDHIPYSGPILPFGIVACIFPPTTFLKIAVYLCVRSDRGVMVNFEPGRSRFKGWIKLSSR